MLVKEAESKQPAAAQSRDAAAAAEYYRRVAAGGDVASGADVEEAEGLAAADAKHFAVRRGWLGRCLSWRDNPFQCF